MASDLQHGDGNATLRRVSLGWMSSARRCTTIWPLFGPGKQWMFCARRCLLTLPFSIRTDPCRTQSPLKLFYKIQWISYGSIGFNGIRHAAMYGNRHRAMLGNMHAGAHIRTQAHADAHSCTQTQTPHHVYNKRMIPLWFGQLFYFFRGFI